jgi:hypothetical protein
MTFGYIGYIWAIVGCASLFLLVLGSAAALHAVGRRLDRRGASRAHVQSLPVAERNRGGREPAAGAPVSIAEGSIAEGSIAEGSIAEGSIEEGRRRSELEDA